MLIRRVAPTCNDAPVPSARLHFTVLRGCAFALLAVLSFAAWSAGGTSDIVVRVQKDGPTISVEVECPVTATRAVVLDVLTDYDNMAKFISNLEQSVVRIHTGNRLMMYQKGKASRGPLTFPFENILRRSRAIK